ncbi:MAG TPA: DsbA family protein [Hyphomicrobiaceae bacterium]|nr:DsbA family protein [Hyphomicrobiaceae bacterium]
MLLIARSLVFVVLAMLTGCSGAALPTGSVASDTASGIAGVSTDKPAFNPFNDPTLSVPGGREVIEKPTLADVMLTGTLPDMSLGRTEAPVTIIKYMSLTCPYCRKFQLEVFPVLKRDYIDKGKVRFILREFPIGHQSGQATVALRCAGQQRFFPLYEKFLTQQVKWVSQEVRLEPIFEIARQVGMSRTEFDSCFKNQGMVDGLKWVKERGRKLGVIGTPNFFINGRLVKSVLGLKELKEIIDPLIAGGAPAPRT